MGAVDDGPSKRVKKGDSKEEEKKEEVKELPDLIRRRSSRNDGKVVNYDIDAILDAAEKD